MGQFGSMVGNLEGRGMRGTCFEAAMPAVRRCCLSMRVVLPVRIRSTPRAASSGIGCGFASLPLAVLAALRQRKSRCGFALRSGRGLRLVVLRSGTRQGLAFLLGLHDRHATYDRLVGVVHGGQGVFQRLEATVAA